MIALASPKTQAVIPLPQLKANFSLSLIPWLEILSLIHLFS